MRDTPSPTCPWTTKPHRTPPTHPPTHPPPPTCPPCCRRWRRQGSTCLPCTTRRQGRGTRGWARETLGGAQPTFTRWGAKRWAGRAGLLWVAVVVGGWWWLGGRATQPVRCMRDGVRPLSHQLHTCGVIFVPIFLPPGRWTWPAPSLATAWTCACATWTQCGSTVRSGEPPTACSMQHAACRRRTSLVHALVRMAAPAWQTTTSTTRCLPALPTAPSYFFDKLEAPSTCPCPCTCPLLQTPPTTLSATPRPTSLPAQTICTPQTLRATTAWTSQRPSTAP